MKTRFFFSLAHLLDNLEKKTDDDFSLTHLSLGDTIHDWYGATIELSRSIYDDLIEDSREIFNRHTERPFTRRQVEILVGNLCFHLAERVARSEAQLKKLPTGFRILNCDPNDIGPKKEFELPLTTLGAMELLRSEEFGCLIDFLSMQRLLQSKDLITIKMISSQQVIPFSKSSFSERFINTAYIKIQSWLKSWSRKNKIFILSPYLGRFGVIWLNTILGQIPTLLETRPAHAVVSKPTSRMIEFATSLSFRDHVKSLLSCLIPIRLLETLDDTVEFARNIGFPSNPALTFTSNAFFFDDEFKANLAVPENRSIYVVGQHGNYGVSLLHDPGPELAACDAFLSWGWTRRDEKVTPFGQLKPNVKVRVQRNLTGLTLFLRNELESFLFADMTRPNLTYFENVIDLCRRLNGLRIKTELRLHNSLSPTRIESLMLAIEGLENVTIASDRPSIEKLVQSGKGIVFTYDSTGMVEMSSSGLPFFAFLPDGLDSVRVEFKSNYEGLAEGGLLAQDASQAADLLSHFVNKWRRERILHIKSVINFGERVVFYPRQKFWKLRSLLVKLKNSNTREGG